MAASFIPSKACDVACWHLTDVGVLPNVRFALPAQPVDATQALNFGTFLTRSSPDHKLNLSRAGNLPPGVDLPKTLGIDAAPALLKEGNTSVHAYGGHQITKCLSPGTRDPLSPDYLRAVLPLPAPASDGALLGRAALKRKAKARRARIAAIRQVH